MNRSCNLLFLCAWIPALAGAGPARNIELVDGSVVRAEVISLEQGVYTLRSGGLGEMRIPAAQVKSITTPGAPTAAYPAGNVQIDDIRRSLAQDPNAIGSIQTLQNDPLVRSILNDEATMRAIQAGDLDRLMNDPKIKALMAHPTVREITQGAGP